MAEPRADNKKSDGDYSEEETARRRDAALKRALDMKPKPHAEKPKKMRPKKSLNL